MDGTFRHRHLFGLRGYERGDILSILEVAESFREIGQRKIKKVPTLRGRTVLNLFFEPSTRTRTSFELAEKRLSADSVNFSTSTSSTKKGESLKDTMLTLDAMAPDIIVVRHKSIYAGQFLAQHTDASIINAGDGTHEHPTQALLDMLTVKQCLGKLEGLRIAIIGDITHSRVARSNMIGWRMLGSKVTICGPPTMIPPYAAQEFGCYVTHRVEEAIEEADVIMMLRIQLERQQGPLFPSSKEYFNRYGLTSEKLKCTTKQPIIMHPGPINRGVEIDPAIADGPYSVILEQVANGVAVRMALLYLLMGDEKDEF